MANSSGTLYIFSKNLQTDSGETVEGCHKVNRDPVEAQWVRDSGKLPAVEAGKKFCDGCARERDLDLFNAAFEGEKSVDGRHHLCRDCQRHFEPRTLGLKWCSKCAENGGDGWVAEAAFSAGSTYCKIHESERQRELRALRRQRS